ncbi:MAG: MlaD family protein [Pseudomonadota bacterium]
MARLSTEAKLGLFVLLGIVLLAYLSLSVGQWDWFGGRGYDIHATFHSVAGLKKDVPVEIAGVEVGRVSDINLIDSKARVTMHIKDGVKIPADSAAVIQTKGVLGEKYVEIIPPSSVPGDLAATDPPAGPGKRYVQPGGELKNTRSAADLDRLLRTIGDVAEDIRSVSRSLSGSLSGPQGEENLRVIIANIRDMTTNLNEAVADNKTAFREMIRNFAYFSQDLRQLTAQNRGTVNETLANLHEASGQLQRAMAAIERLAQNVEQGKGVLGTLTADKDAGENIEATIASLRDITQKVDEGKGTLGKLINDETTIAGLNKTIDNFARYQQKFEDFKTFLGFRGEYLTRGGDGKGYLSLRVQPKEDKYYLLEILRDPGFTTTSKEVVTTTDTPPGTTVVQRTEKKKKDEIKFSLELAKRLRNLVVRGGIIESTGGAGLDYCFLDDHLRLSLEAFDFGRDGGAHLKAYANYNFLKYFYLTAGYDDFTSSSRSSPLIGAGVTFLDDDIKYLLTGAPVSFSTK